jgi:PPOX class probable F420-dependent enzyme
MTPQIPEGYEHLLHEPLFAHLATVTRDGRPVSNPMWFLYEDGLILFTNTTNRPQYHNLEHEPRLALSIIDPEEPYRYLGVGAVVERVEPDPEGTLFERLAERYSVDIQLDDASNRVIIGARPTRFWKQ